MGHAAGARRIYKSFCRPGSRAMMNTLYDLLGALPHDDADGDCRHKRRVGGNSPGLTATVCPDQSERLPSLSPHSAHAGWFLGELQPPNNAGTRATSTGETGGTVSAASEMIGMADIVECLTPTAELTPAGLPRRQRDAARHLPDRSRRVLYDQVSPPAKISFLMTA